MASKGPNKRESGPDSSMPGPDFLESLYDLQMRIDVFEGNAVASSTGGYRQVCGGHGMPLGSGLAGQIEGRGPDG